VVVVVVPLQLQEQLVEAVVVVVDFLPLHCLLHLAKISHILLVQVVLLLLVEMEQQEGPPLLVPYLHLVVVVVLVVRQVEVVLALLAEL
jgi:hypothetical protein